MSWSKVKTVLIVVLLAVDLFFVYNIFRFAAANNYVSSEEKELISELFKDSGMVVDPDIIPDKKPDLRVYEGNIDESYQLSVAARLGGSDDLASYMIADDSNGTGVRFIVRSSGAVFDFFGGFNFRYCGFDADSKSMDEFSALAETYTGYSESDRRDWYDITEIISDFCFTTTGEERIDAVFEAFDFVAADVRHDDKTDRLFFAGNQTIDGYKINGCSVFAVICEGRVEYIEGNVILSGRGIEKYRTELYDQINILFKEKEARDAELIAGSTQTLDIGEKLIQNIELTEMNCEYCINWSGDRKIFYLIPAWRMEYGEKNAVIRNAVNGSLYIF